MMSKKKSLRYFKIVDFLKLSCLRGLLISLKGVIWKQVWETLMRAFNTLTLKFLVINLNVEQENYLIMLHSMLANKSRVVKLQNKNMVATVVYYQWCTFGKVQNSSFIYDKWISYFIKHSIFPSKMALRGLENYLSLIKEQNPGSKQKKHFFFFLW